MGQSGSLSLKSAHDHPASISIVVTERFRDVLTAGDPWKYQYEGIAELEVLRVTSTAVLLMDTVESVTGMLRCTC